MGWHWLRVDGSEYQELSVFEGENAFMANTYDGFESACRKGGILGTTGRTGNY